MRHGLGKPGSGYPRGRLSYVLLKRGMAVNVSFSIAPQGLEEVFQEMVKTIPEKALRGVYLYVGGRSVAAWTPRELGHAQREGLQTARS